MIGIGEREQSRRAGSRPPTADGGSEGLVILLVDDDEAMARLYCRLLEGAGHRVEAATDPRDALDLAEAGFDLVVSDVHMPVMNGPEFATEIRRRRPEQPLCFCTASSPDDDLVAHARLIGHVIDKDARARSLLALLDSLARQYRHRTREARVRRRVPRVEIALPIDVTIENTLTVQAKTCNISDYGVLFRAAGTFSVGDHLKLCVSEPDRDSYFDVFGSVVRVESDEPPAVAVELADSPPRWRHLCELAVVQSNRLFGTMRPRPGR